MKSLKNKWILSLVALFVFSLCALYLICDIKYSAGILSWRTVAYGAGNVHSNFWDRHVRIDGKNFHHLYGERKAFEYAAKFNVVFFVVRDNLGGFQLHVYDRLKQKDAIFSGDSSGFGYNLGAESCTVDISDLNSTSKRVVIDTSFERRIFELNYVTFIVVMMQ